MNQYLRILPGRKGNSPSAEVDAREKLRDYQRLAWNAHLDFAQALTIPQLKANTEGFLTIKVIPAFSRIGVDRTFAEELICLASEAWASLETTPGKTVRLHPSKQRDIDEVRQGILLQAERKASVVSKLAVLTPEQLHEHLQVAVDPASLHLLLDEISTPWITLPRAYSFLRREHIHYLPAYLEVVDNDSNADVVQVFTRIIIEFLANFTIRFAEERFPREQVVCLVTAGYLALFCKNLITPPGGFVGTHAFEHFFSWLKYSRFPKTAFQAMRLPDLEVLSLLK